MFHATTDSWFGDDLAGAAEKSRTSGRMSSVPNTGNVDLIAASI
jgi:hypothetical protein